MIDTIIEKNIPVPDKSRGIRGKLRKLEVGDSILYPESKRNSVGTTITSYFHKETEMAFTSSSIEQPEGFFRVWRDK